MTNSNFSNYVTGGAFQLSLSHRQIDALSFTKVWVKSGLLMDLLATMRKMY